MDPVSNSLIIFSSKILVGIFLFLSDIVVARFLGPTGLGIFNLFLAVNGIALLLGSLGFGTASIYFSNKEKKDFSQLFSNSLAFGLVWGVMLSLLTFLLFILFPVIFSGLSLKYLIIVLVTIPFVILYNYCLPLLLAKFRIIAWSTLSVLYAVCIFVVSFIFIVFLKWGAYGAVLAVFIAVLGNFILTFAYLFKSYKPRKSFDLPLFWDQLKFGASAYLGDIFSTINFKLNIFVVNIFLGVLSVGYYSVSYNIAAVIFIIPYSLQQVLYSTWSSAPETEVDQKTPRVARQALMFSIVSAFLLAFIGRFFIIFFYGNNFLPAITPFYLILPGGVCAAFAGIFFNNFFAKGKPYITSIILLSSLVLNILLSIIFIPKMGVSGAALAASISYFFSSVVAMIIFCRITKQPIKEVIFIKRSDITLLFSHFFRLFTSVGKVLREIKSKDIEGLTDYYEKKADEYDIIQETFESEKPFKRVLYATRVRKIMGMLDIKPSDSVLEIGCGEGYYTNKILEKTGNIIATDISAKFLEKAKINTHNRAKNYMACPAEKIPFPDNYFDKILISEVIEHLLDWEEGAKEMLRILKPGGFVVISTPSKFSYLNVICHIKIILRNEPLDGDHIREFSRIELSKLLTKYFEINKYGYANYFPLIIPKFIAKFFGIENIEKLVFFVEDILSRIFFIKEQGLVFFIKAKKRDHV